MRSVLMFSGLVFVAACGTNPPPAAPSTPGPAIPAGEPAKKDATPGAERPRFTSFPLDGNALVLPGPIVFKDGNELDVDASVQALWLIHDYLEAKPYVTLVRIEGHGDQAGQDALMATGERALAVGRWLVAQGIACDRLLVAAFGSTKPKADGSTPEGRAANRRIEVVNAALRGRAIGGMPLDGSAPAAAPVCDQ